MDFEFQETEEQRRFRAAVSAWLDENLPRSAGREDDAGAWGQWRRFREALGRRGWLAPSLSQSWGGGGLTSDCARVLRDELEKQGLHWLLGDGLDTLLAALHDRGTDDQRGQFLPLIATGRAVTWSPAIEDGAQLDTTTLGVQAFRDGDDFILTGEERFRGPGPQPDYLWALAITSPKAAHPQPTTAFLLPASLEGIGIHTPDSLVPGLIHVVTFDQVRVPPFCLLGEKGDGWSVLQESSPIAPGVRSRGAGEVAELIQYAQQTALDGVPLSKEPYLQQLLVDAYLEDHVITLLRKRNAWMASTGKALTYHASQVARMEKRATLHRARVSRDVAGPYALLDHRDPRAAFRGRFELRQRESLAEQNPGGGPEAHAIEIAKQLGLGERKSGRGPPAQQSVTSHVQAR